MIELQEKSSNGFGFVNEAELKSLRSDGPSLIDPDLPNDEEMQRLLSRLDDKLLSAFARQALPAIVAALRENDLNKIQETLGDWIATFEEYATPGAVDKIARTVKDIKEEKGIPWEEIQAFLKTQ